MPGLCSRSHIYTYPKAGREDNSKTPEARGNPDPANFKILQSVQRGEHLLVEVRYPDCQNCEGRKILFYKNTQKRHLSGRKELDPHFSDDPEMLSPFARFEPTQEGWDAAERLAEIL